jgi:hypothetical protein
MKTLMRISFLALVATLLFITAPSTTWATGFGLGITFHDDKIDITESPSGAVDRPSYGTSSIGVNLVLDTAVAKRRLFNYRLSLGYERQTFDYPNEEELQDGEEAQRITVGNTFGFAVAQTAQMRVWLGPRLALGYAFDSNKSADYYNLNLGLAPVIGVNFHLSPVTSLGLELGYEYSHYETYAPGLGLGNKSGARQGPFLNAVILFRTHEDRWQAADKPADSHVQTPGIRVPQ